MLARYQMCMYIHAVCLHTDAHMHTYLSAYMRTVLSILTASLRGQPCIISPVLQVKKLMSGKPALPEVTHTTSTWLGPESMLLAPEIRTLVA